MKIESLLEIVLPEERRYFGLILLVAALGHLAAFFVFKVPPLPQLRQPKGPMQVVLWGEDVGGSSRLDPSALRVMEVRDPRVAVLPPEEPVRVFAQRLPVLRGLDEPMVAGEMDSWLAMDLPSYRERIKVVGARWEPLPMPVVVESPPALRGSSWQVSGALADRKVVHRPVLGRPEADTALGVTVIRLQVGKEGLVLVAHVTESSGSFEVDRQGLAAVRRMAFEPVAAPDVEAGQITLFWDYAERGLFPEPAGGNP
ncbi:MAG: hypothetical protein OHK005_00870 [Candidatus Methylacidiphilales bacterium]